MSSAAGESSSSRTRGVAVYLAGVQFLFVTCWTIYVIFLPDLLEAAGVPRRYAIYILMLDQLIFMAMDIVMGMAADRAARVLGRVGPLIVAATAFSCIAFLLIPTPCTGERSHPQLRSSCS